MILDPYLTSYGSLVNTTKTRKDVLNYIASTPLTNLNYEFQDLPNTKMVFITGCTQEEKDLAVFDHPITLEFKNKKYIVSDIRKYIKQLDNQPLNLMDSVRDLANATYVIDRALFLSDFIEGRIGLYRKFFKPVITAYAEFFSYVVNTAVALTPAEFFSTKFVSAWFAYTLFMDKEDIEDNALQIEAFLSTIKVGASGNKELAKKIMASMKEIDYEPTLDNLVSRVKATINQDKAKIISTDLLVNIMANMWYGHGGSESMIISMEHIPTWMAMTYCGLSNNSYKKTRLATVLMKYSRDINVTDYCKNVGLFVKERVVG